MAELFSDEWMKGLKDAWNAEPEVKDKLGRDRFRLGHRLRFQGRGPASRHLQSKEWRVRGRRLL